MKTIVIFEDEKWVNFKPLSSTKPVSELKTGIYSLSDKIKKRYSKYQILFSQREIFNTVYNTDYLYKNNDTDDKIILLNSRVVADKELDLLIDTLGKKNETTLAIQGEDIVAGCFINQESLNLFLSTLDITDFKSMNSNCKLVSYPWDLVNMNGEEIENDLNYWVKENNVVSIDDENITKINNKDIYIADNVKIKAGTIIDAEDGPVIIDSEAKVMHNSVIIGPCYIGKSSTVKIGAKIYENTSVGEVCKVGGEIEGTIIHAYSNKQHDGFLGHAYIGEWCNFGADTNNSDLKNNYSNVMVEINGKLIDTGSMFVGLIMGDHSKTGINTMLNTGTVIGVGCNVFGEGFPPRNIPDFNWGGKEKLIKYPFRRIMETAKIVMNRRNIELSDNLINIYTSLK